MGLGTKIKEALSGDKDHDKASKGSQRRRAPGAYPESSTDIPRTANADTWQSTGSSNKRASPVAKSDDIAEDEGINEYTHVPAENPAFHDDEELLPSPDSRIINTHNGNMSKEQRQAPYWGNVGKADTAAKNRDVLDANKIVAVNDKPVEDDYLGRSGTINSTHPALRDGDGAGTNHARNTSQLQAPVGSVNHGRPQLVDDEAAMANSMVASQVSQPTQYDDEYANGGLSYGGAGYNNQYQDYSMQRSDTINTRGPMANGRETFGSPTHNGPRSFSPQPNQAWVQHPDGLPNNRAPFQGNEQFSAGCPPAPGFAARDFGQGQQGPARPVEQSAREQVSPAHSSENGSGRFADGHYGPGHSGAKVMHRCAHCGNDNDITKYFSKDVVYRLS
jgi:hypothetical protein